MNEPLVVAQAVVKRFGFKTVLRGIDLSLDKGECLVLLGRNGAGKSTLIKILCGVMQPDAGRIFVQGTRMRRDRPALRGRVGALPHQALLYTGLSAQENLVFFGRMYGLSDLEARIEQVLTRVGMSRFAHELVGTFSRGMQQRLAIARALLHDPAVLLLDEPFTGLDHEGARALKDLMAEFQQRGGAILMATHDVEGGMALGSRAALLNHGRLHAKPEFFAGSKRAARRHVPSPKRQAGLEP